MTETGARWIARVGLAVGGLEVVGLLTVGFAPTASRLSVLTAVFTVGAWIGVNTLFWIRVVTRLRKGKGNARIPEGTKRWVIAFAISTILSLVLALG